MRVIGRQSLENFIRRHDDVPAGQADLAAGNSLRVELELFTDRHLRNHCAFADRAAAGGDRARAFIRDGANEKWFAHRSA